MAGYVLSNLKRGEERATRSFYNVLLSRCAKHYARVNARRGDQLDAQSRADMTDVELRLSGSLPDIQRNHLFIRHIRTVNTRTMMYREGYHWLKVSPLRSLIYSPNIVEDSLIAPPVAEDAPREHNLVAADG